MSVTQLRQLELHDMPVTGLHFDLRNERLLISLSQYAEEIQDYRPVTLTFQQVSDFESGPWLLEVLSDDDLEWYSSQVQPDGAAYTVSIVLRGGFGKPSIALRFRFSQVVVEV